MEMEQLYKAVLEADHAPVVLCGLDHSILYMNRAAIARYAKWGGAELLGSSLLDCHGPLGCERIEQVLAWFSEDPGNNMVYESRNDDEDKDVYMVALRDDEGALLGYYEKHEFRTRETAGFYEMGAGATS